MRPALHAVALEASHPCERFHADGAIPAGAWIWVFGSNELGKHGKGAAKVAHVSFGAKYGVGAGPTGRAYAIATKRRPTKLAGDRVPLTEIAGSVKAFLQYAAERPRDRFFVTAVGTGLAGYTDAEIEPLFARASINCSLPEQWRVWCEVAEDQNR